MWYCHRSHIARVMLLLVGASLLCRICDLYLFEYLWQNSLTVIGIQYRLV